MIVEGLMIRIINEGELILCQLDRFHRSGGLTQVRIMSDGTAEEVR